MTFPRRPAGPRGLFTRRQALAASAGAALVPHALATPAPFPDKSRTLQIVVPFAAGGGVDNAARLLKLQ